MINKVINLMKEFNYIKNKEQESIYRKFIESYIKEYEKLYNRKPSINWILKQKYPKI